MSAPTKGTTRIRGRCWRHDRPSSEFREEFQTESNFPVPTRATVARTSARDRACKLPLTPGRGSAVGRVLLEGSIAHLPDVLAVKSVNVLVFGWGRPKRRSQSHTCHGTEKRKAGMRRVPLALAIAFVLAVTFLSPVRSVRAEPQTRTFYSPKGQETGRATTRGNTTTFSNERGQEIGRSERRGDGTTNFYNERGQIIGTSRGR
jgi:hypothetical protein